MTRKIFSLEGAWAGGKTSILRIIQQKGGIVCPSIVPNIYDLKGRLSYTPRQDPIEFTNMFQKFKDQQFTEANILYKNQPMFFDRVFFAPIVLRKFFGLEVPGKFYDLAKNPNLAKTIFLVEPIPIEYHKNGWPRKHFSYSEALIYHQITKDVIIELGFDVCEIPFMLSVEKRAQLVIEEAKLILKEESKND